MKHWKGQPHVIVEVIYGVGVAELCKPSKKLETDGFTLQKCVLKIECTAPSGVHISDTCIHYLRLYALNNETNNRRNQPCDERVVIQIVWQRTSLLWLQSALGPRERARANYRQLSSIVALASGWPPSRIYVHKCTQYTTVHAHLCTENTLKLLSEPSARAGPRKLSMDRVYRSLYSCGVPLVVGYNTRGETNLFFNKRHM